MRDIEELVYRIINGYYYLNINNITYKIVSPSLSIKQQAHDLYLSVISGNKFDDSNWLRKSETINILQNNQIWNNEKEEQLKILNNRLDDMKIELYLKFLDPTMKKKIKASLETGKNKIQELTNLKNSMDYLTLENYAEGLKNEYIILKTVYDNNEILAFGDSADTLFFESIVTAINKSAMGMDTLRAVARNDLWKSYWDAAKENVFPLPAYNWTDEQRLLINLSKMYDSVRDHPESPDDDVTADDDALDGWMLFHKRKVEKERKKTKLMDSVGGKYKNANEIFIVTNSIEEAKEVYSLNDPEAMAAINHMKTLSQTSDKPIQWADLPHVKMELQNKLKQKSQTSLPKGK
jgi:hypothetical protein